MSRTWPPEPTGSSDEYETDNYSPSEGSASSDDVDIVVGGSGGRGIAASSSSSLGTSRGISGGNSNNRRGRPAAPAASASSAPAPSARKKKKKKTNELAERNRKVARVALRDAGRSSTAKPTARASRRSSGGDSGEKRRVAVGARRSPRNRAKAADVEILSSDDDDDDDDDDDSLKEGLEIRKKKGTNGKNAEEESDSDEYETDDDDASQGMAKKAAGGTSSSGRRASKRVDNGRKSRASGAGSGSDVGEDEDEDEDEDYGERASSDDTSSSSEEDFLPRNNKRRKKTRNLDSSSSSSDSDDSMDLGRNRSQALLNRRRKVMNRGFSSSSSESEDDDSDAEVGIKRKKAAKSKSTRASARGKNLSDDSDSSGGTPRLGTTSRKRPGRRARSPAARKPASAAKRVPAEEAAAVLSSDDEILAVAVTTPAKKTSPTRARSSRRSSRKRSARKLPPEHDPLVRAATNRALEESRRARQALRAAQDYEAEEVELTPRNAPPSRARAEASSSGTANGRGAPAAEAAATSRRAAPPVEAVVNYVGPSIRLAVRYQNPTSNKEAKSTVRIKIDQPLKHLLDEFGRSNPGLRVSVMKFDGDNLNLTQTPEFYDMEDEDLVDATVVAAPVHPRSPAGRALARAASRAAEAQYTIHVRQKGREGGSNSHTFKIRKTDPLSKLVDAYCRQHNFTSVALEHEGRELDATRSPCELGLPSVARLDATTVGTPSSSSSAAGGLGAGVPVKFRVNGDSADVVTLSVPLQSDFRSAMSRFAERRGVTPPQCRFVFDGEALPPGSTPEGLDLEGGEIVDVAVPVAAPVANPREGGGARRPRHGAGAASVVANGAVATPARANAPEVVDLEEEEEIVDVTTPDAAAGSGGGARKSKRGATVRGGTRAATAGSDGDEADARDAPPAKISVKTNRNRNNNPRQKTWKLLDTDSLSKLKTDYVKLYKSKGCRNVRFYFANALVRDVEETFRELGIGEGDLLYAMENGKVYKPV